MNRKVKVKESYTEKIDRITLELQLMQIYVPFIFMGMITFEEAKRRVDSITKKIII